MTYPTTITAEPGTPFLDTVRDFDATPEVLFRAQTDPELITNWLGPRRYSMTVDYYDARPGGSYRYTHNDDEGNSFGFRGVFHTVQPGELVIQTFEFEGAPGFVSLETARYEDLGDGRTRLHGHSVFPSVEARDMAFASGMEGGMRESMDRLDEVVASLTA